MKSKKLCAVMFSASMLLTSGFAPACKIGGSGGGGEHTHTYATEWTKNETGHWHAATCEHTDLRGDYAAHSDSDGDFVCDVCAYVIHTHTFATEWSSDADSHWHASTCGHDVRSDEAAHADGNGDGKCDTCGYTISAVTPPEHTHTFASSWTKNETGHWHAATCEHTDLKDDYAAHSDSDGDFVCDVCGYVIHTHTFAPEWSSDKDSHWHASTCEHDVRSDQAAHSDSDGNGKCDVCGYQTGEVGGEDNIVTYSYVGQECVAFEWSTSDAASATVQYRVSTSSGYTSVDRELIRQLNDNTARVDIVGLRGGNVYDFKIVSDGVTYIKSGVTVSAYDRSGYAHFGYSSGVGGYNDDGTAKSGAAIVYVTEATKNTVTAKVGSKTYTGIVSILQNAAKDDTSLIVRIIGTVGAATWNEITYTPAGDKLTAEEVKGANGKQLPTDHKDITQAELIAGGYNTLNTTEYSELIGLSSKATYSGGEYDSAWNNCMVQGSSNITIEGIGEDARIFQWGLTFKDCSSIEVRNITFEDYTEDACSVEAGDTSATSVTDFEFGRIWLHHNTFEEGKNYWDVCAEQDKHEGDGATDFKGIANVTVSYNEYHNNHKTGLVGGSNSHTTANLTYHHNFYNECMSRMPLARQANIHIYNNYYLGSTGTNMSLRASAYAFIENCYFDNAKNPIVSETDSTYGSGYAKIFGCIFKGNEIDEKYADNLVIVTDREQRVANTTKFGQNFDTDETMFYYDAANKRSDVENMLTAEEVKTQIPLLAGVMKHSGDTGSDVGGTTDPDEGGTTTGNSVDIMVETAQAYALGTVMATLSDNGSEIATITASCAFTDKKTHCQADGGSNAQVLSIVLEEGYVYTITLKVGSSGASGRVLTLNTSDGSSGGVTQTGGESTNFLDCIWVELSSGSYTLMQSANIRLQSITIVATPIS